MLDSAFASFFLHVPYMLKQTQRRLILKGNEKPGVYGIYSRRAFISYFSRTRVKYSLFDRLDYCLAADASLSFSSTSTPLNLKEIS